MSVCIYVHKSFSLIMREAEENTILFILFPMEGFPFRVVKGIILRFWKNKYKAFSFSR